MMPCSSGNSPTMSVSRSALASSAAALGLLRQHVAAELLRRSRAAMRAHALARARPACPACCDRPPCPAPARAIRASSCGPGRRRTWRRPGAGAPRARCRRSTRLASAGRMLLTTRNLLRQLACGVEQREVLLVRLHRQDQAFLRHVEELRLELARRSTLGRSTSAVTSSSSASSSIGVRPCLARRRAAAGARSRRGARRSWRSPRPRSSSWRA